jgi:peptidoglycan/LPS O-acetylase OafA/YrhL
MSSQAGKRLLEADILRPLAVLLVVVLHSFTIYWGKWSPPEGYLPCVPYKWIAATCFSFTMELFVLLSGYVFGYQIFVQNRQFTLKSLAVNKLKRLIVPSLIFGLIYALIFYLQRGFLDAAYAVLNGAGHLWFLPMLFWCFLSGFLLHRSGMMQRTKLLILLAAVMLSVISFPLRLDKTLYYIFFFYLGIVFMQRQDICRKLSANNSFLISMAIIWLTLFISYELVLPSLPRHYETGLLEAGVKLLKKFWIFSYASAGTLFSFMLAYRIMQKRNNLPKSVLFCTSVSFGVYLFHQIVIEVLYYKTSLPVLVGPYWLPWVGLGIALTLSILLVLLVRKLNLKFLGI